MSHTEKILNSLNRIERAQAPAQFYASIRAKMQRQEKELAPQSFSLKPIFVTAVLLLFFITNIYILVGINKDKKEAKKETIAQGVQIFASEYNLTTKSLGE